MVTVCTVDICFGGALARASLDAQVSGGLEVHFRLKMRDEPLK